jgi:hypothetical protein
MTPRQPLRERSEVRCQLLPGIGEDERGSKISAASPMDRGGFLVYSLPIRPSKVPANFIPLAMKNSKEDP